jgi:hypothetical protein
MFDDLKNELDDAVFNLMAAHDAEILERAEVCRYLFSHDAASREESLRRNSEWIERHCQKIHAVGEQLFSSGGLTALRSAFEGFDSRTARAVETLWNGIGGVFWA